MKECNQHRFVVVRYEETRVGRCTLCLVREELAALLEEQQNIDVDPEDDPVDLLNALESVSFTIRSILDGLAPR